VYYLGNTDWISNERNRQVLHKVLKSVAPVFALMLAAGVTGCDNVHVDFGDDQGVPLAELDKSGAAPTELVLAGPDTVVVDEGSTLDIAVSGDQAAVDALRFKLSHGSLAIMRKNHSGNINGRATVHVTMPAIEKLTVAGSGTVEATALAGKSEVTIAGSGTAHTAKVAAHSLEVTIAGSGSYRAAGVADALELTVAGAGKADMAGLTVDRAKVTIAGSGDASFASDGTVSATIMGSGDVSVAGRATCKLTSMGSGTLRCTPGNGAPPEDVAHGGPNPPTPPAPPPAPGE
jgi:carbon monoxide dehydrogenase subunit G